MSSRATRESVLHVQRQKKWGVKCGKLASTALVGGVFCLTPIAAALAQTVGNQTNATQAENKIEELEVVTIRGYGSSLAAAQNVKRNSSVVVEAITPEDLGKFTDNSIADQLQRVPGVQIDRGTDGRSGDHISVRGIGAQYITTTINGRTPGGYGKEGQQFLREFAVDVLPAEVLSGARVYKSSSAEMIEAGLGGAVDYQTLRPLDYKTKDGKTYFGSFTAKAQQNQGSGDPQSGDSVSGIVGGQLADKTFGFVLAGLNSKNPFQMDWMEANSVGKQQVNVQAADGTVSHPSVIYPNNFTIGRTRREDRRTAISADLQWKPNDEWDINVDFLSSKYNRPDDRDTYVNSYNSNNTLAGTFLPGGITINHGAVTGLDFSKYVPPADSSGLPTVLGFPIAYNNDSTTQVGGVNVKWHRDKLAVNADFSRSETHTLQDLAWYYAAYTYPSFAGLNYTANSSGPATFNAGGPSLAAASNFDTIGALRRFFKTKNDGESARLDLSYELSDNYVLKTGVRYSKAEVDARNAYTASFALTPSQLDMMKGVLYPGSTDQLFAGRNVGSFGNLPTQHPNSIDRNVFFPAFDQGKAPFAGDFWNASQPQGPWAGSTDPGIGYMYGNDETITAAYAQLDFDTRLLGMRADGNVGVRVVRTHQVGRAYQAVTTQSDAAGTQLSTQNFVPAETSSTYTNVLPSFNLALHPSQETNLRFSAGQTMSRPDYLDLAPNNNLTVPSAALHQSDPSIAGTGTSGNAELKPATSWNFDTTLEYYTPGGASYVASLFYKRVSDFIAPAVTFNTTLPGYGSQQFNLTQPQNMSSGSVVGLELGLNQPLRQLLPALDGFGIQVNYTYVDSKIDQPISGEQMTFPGVSKHNVNGTVYYNKGDWDARVAVVYRSAYLSQFPWAGYVPFPISTDASVNVDASISYKVTEHLDITLTGMNLTKQTRRNYLMNSDVFAGYYEVPTSFAVALRASF